MVDKVITHSKYKKAYNKLLAKNKNDIVKDIDETVDKLMNYEITSQKHNHPLKGKLKGYNDLHIRGDIILIYKYENNKLHLILHNVGSHKDVLEDLEFLNRMLTI